jgi:hypothetical protein
MSVEKLLEKWTQLCLKKEIVLGINTNNDGNDHINK